MLHQHNACIRWEKCPPALRAGTGWSLLLGLLLDPTGLMPYFFIMSSASEPLLALHCSCCRLARCACMHVPGTAGSTADRPACTRRTLRDCTSCACMLLDQLAPMRPAAARSNCLYSVLDSSHCLLRLSSAIERL